MFCLVLNLTWMANAAWSVPLGRSAFTSAVYVGIVGSGVAHVLSVSTGNQMVLQSAGYITLHSHQQQQSSLTTHPRPHLILSKCYLNSRKDC